MNETELINAIADKITSLLNLERRCPIEQLAGKKLLVQLPKNLPHETLVNYTMTLVSAGLKASYRYSYNEKDRSNMVDNPSIILHDQLEVIIKKLNIETPPPIESLKITPLEAQEINYFKALNKEFLAAIENQDVLAVDSMIKKNPGLINAVYYDESCCQQTSCKPIHLAARLGNIEIFTVLSKSPGVDLNEKEKNTVDECTPLMIAIENTHFPIALSLINDPRVDLNSTNKQGRNALHLAIMYRKISPSPKGSNMIENNRCIISALLHTDTDKFEINRTDNNGYTALHALISTFDKEDEKLLTLLLSHPKIDVNSKNNNLDTPLHTALNWHKSIGAIRFLLQHPGIKVNEVNQYGFTQLHIIAKRTGLTCFNNNKIDARYISNAVDQILWWQLHHALYEHKHFFDYSGENMAEEAVKLLIEKGANVRISTGKLCLIPGNSSNADKIDIAPLLLTTNLVIIKMLVDKGADVKSAILHYAEVSRTLFEINAHADNKIVKAIDNELSRISEAISMLQYITPTLFNDTGTIGQLKAILAYSYMDEVESGLSFMEKVQRYNEILDLSNDLSKHPDESRVLRGFILGIGKPLDEQGYVSAYKERVANEFDSIRHVLIKQQTFSSDKSERYITATAVMLGIRFVIANRIIELEMEYNKECAVRKIQAVFRMNRFLSKANKVVHEHNKIKTFIGQYDNAVSNLGANDIGQKQRIGFVRDQSEKYKVAILDEQRIQSAINTMLRFFKKDNSNKSSKAINLIDAIQLNITSSERHRKFFG